MNLVALQLTGKQKSSCYSFKRGRDYWMWWRPLSVVREDFFFVKQVVFFAMGRLQVDSSQDCSFCNKKNIWSIYCLKVSNLPTFKVTFLYIHCYLLSLGRIHLKVHCVSFSWKYFFNYQQNEMKLFWYHDVYVLCCRGLLKLACKAASPHSSKFLCSRC